MITLEVALDWLKLSPDGGKQDARVQRLIDAATAAVGREVGRYLGEPAAAEAIRRGGSPLVQLADEPVDTETVTVQTRCYPTDPWLDAESTDYVREGRNFRAAWCWPAWVKITFTRGYELDAGPAELQQLVLELLDTRWKAWANGLNSDMASETFGDYSYTRRDVMSADSWATVAARWQRGMA